MGRRSTGPRPVPGEFERFVGVHFGLLLVFFSHAHRRRRLDSRHAHTRCGGFSRHSAATAATLFDIINISANRLTTSPKGETNATFTEITSFPSKKRTQYANTSFAEKASPIPEQFPFRTKKIQLTTPSNTKLRRQLNRPRVEHMENVEGWRISTSFGPTVSLNSALV